VIGVLAGNTNGLNDNDRGEIGVSNKDETRGCTMLPPALREYAVDPVGVETSIPSATASVKNLPPTNIEMTDK